MCETNSKCVIQEGTRFLHPTEKEKKVTPFNEEGMSKARKGLSF